RMEMVLSLLIIERMVLNTNLLGKDSPVQRKSGWKLGNQREDGLVMVLMFGEEGEGPRRGVRENYKHPLTGGLCPSSREVTRMFEVRASQTKLCLGRGRSTFIHIFFLVALDCCSLVAAGIDEAGGRGGVTTPQRATGSKILE